MIGPCLLWHGALSSNGYGVTTRRNRYVLAHRAAYCEAHGLPLSAISGKVVLHACDTPACVRPEHLSAGTQADNMADMVAKGRAPRGNNQHGEPLCWEDVEYIRAEYVRGHRFRKGNSPELLARFGISSSTLSNIILWRHHVNPRD